MMAAIKHDFPEITDAHICKRRGCAHRLISEQSLGLVPRESE